MTKLKTCAFLEIIKSYFRKQPGYISLCCGIRHSNNMSVDIVPVVDLYTKCYIIKFHSYVYSNISLLNAVHGSNLSTLVMHEALYLNMYTGMCDCKVSPHYEYA